MRKSNRKIVHENFHKSTSNHSKVIKENNFTYRHLVTIINKYITSQQQILDIGCGSGTLSLYLAQKGNTVTGIDISEKAVDSCRKSAASMGLSDKTVFEVCDFPNEIPKKKFDLVLLTEVIEHLEDDSLALMKVNSLLNNDGILLLSTPSKNAPLYRLGLANNFDKRVGHLRRYSLDDLVTLCNTAGFSILSKKKNEGVIRNFLFVNPFAGQFVRIINKFNLSNAVTLIDTISLHLLGESDLIIVAKKK